MLKNMPIFYVCVQRFAEWEMGLPIVLDGKLRAFWNGDLGSNLKAFFEAAFQLHATTIAVASIR